MICPGCGAEYRPGFTRCADCDVPLVEAPPQLAKPPRAKKPKPDYASSTPADLVTVLETGDAGAVGLAKSLLQSADIRFLVRGEAVQDLFGVGRIGTGFNLVTGPIAIQVRAEDAGEAGELLAELRDSLGAEPAT